jgi:hypothetical protein
LIASSVGWAQRVRSTPVDSRVLWAPPSIDWPNNLPRPTVPKEMISVLRVGNMQIILEHTNLEDVQKRLGGTIGSRGDAGNSEAWLCLHGANASGRWIFWLSSFEINGPTVGGFQWRRLASNETPDRRCRHLLEGGDRIELPLALDLAMSKAEVRKVMGDPTAVRGNMLIFCHSHREILDKQTYDASNDVAVIFHDSLAYAIEVIETTVN